MVGDLNHLPRTDDSLVIGLPPVQISHDDPWLGRLDAVTPVSSIQLMLGLWAGLYPTAIV